jgi:hypothetical protein
MLPREALVRTDIPEERIASIIRLSRIDEPGTTLAVVYQLLVTANVVPGSPILVTLIMEGLHSPKMSVLTRATWDNIPEDGILHSHRHENLKSYTSYTVYISCGPNYTILLCLVLTGCI